MFQEKRLLLQALRFFLRTDWLTRPVEWRVEDIHAEGTSPDPPFTRPFRWGGAGGARGGRGMGGGGVPLNNSTEPTAEPPPPS